MKNRLILSVLLTFVGILLCGNVFAQDEPRRADGMVNTFIIRNARLSPELIEQFNFIMPGDFALTSSPDSYYTASIMPGTGVLVVTDKALIKPLFPDVKDFKHDGKTVTEDEFYKVPGQMLALVEFIDGILTAETRRDVNDGNPYKDQVVKESEAWFIANYDTPMPAEVALNAPETYFENPNTIVTLDYVITSPAKVMEKKAEVKGYVLRMVGVNPQVYALTNELDLGYFGGEGEPLTAEISSIKGPLTVANICTYFNRPIEDLLLVKTNGKTVVANFRP